MIECLKQQGIKISTRTFQPILNKNGLESHRPRKATLLIPCHNKARLMYAKTFLDEAENYITRFSKNLKVSIVDFGLGGQFSFQQDNDLKHKSKSETTWLKNNKITVLSWPSRCPDQNPIGNLWKKLKIRVGRLQSKTLQQLQDVCKNGTTSRLKCVQILLRIMKPLLSVIK